MNVIVRYTSVLLLLLFVASPAMAYIGPGAGLSLLGALWGLVAAVGAALLFVLIWPFRRMLRRKREAKKVEAEAQQEAQPGQHKGETTDTTVEWTTSVHATSTDPNAPATYDSSAVPDDEKKPSDVGSR